MAYARGPTWPNIAGTPTDPTVAYVASARTIDIREESEITLQVVVAGGAAIAVQLLLEVSLDNETTWRPLHRITIPGAAIGTHDALVRLPQYCQCRMSARRWGGTANTLIFVTGTARLPASDLYLDGQPLELAGHQAAGIDCWSDGAGAAAATGAAFVSGPLLDTDWVPVGRATSGVLEITTVGATTSLELQIVESADDTVTEYSLEAVNNIVLGVVNTMPRVIQIQSGVGALAAGTYRREIDVTPGTAILVRAHDTGAAVDLLVRIRLYGR